MLTSEYRPVKNMPVAKFYYKGTHSHPVRRTVIITENTSRLLTGYELREGSTVRGFNKAPIKTYRKDKVATHRQLRRPKSTTNCSTLQRGRLFDLIKSGI